MNPALRDILEESTTAVFSPSSIAGLVLWLDAADASTITVDGSNNVSEWRDKSGNARHAAQSTALNRPSYTSGGQVNGINAPTFNGTSHHLLTPSVTQAQPTTVFVALRPTSNTLYRGVFDGTTARNAIYGLNGTLNIFAGTELVGTTALTLNSAAQLTAVFNGSSSSLRVNRSAQSSGNSGANSLSGNIYIGRSSNTYWEGQIAEVVAYSAVLSASDRDAVETYLASKWGTP